MSGHGTTPHQHHETTEQDLAGLRRAIAQRGFGLAECRTPGYLPFDYTVGLTRHRGHPELIVVGMCSDCADALLETLATDVQRGRRFRAGDIVDLGYQRGALLQVRQPHRWVVLADRMYRVGGGPAVPALQVVIEQEDGWPWELPEGHPGRTRLLGPPPPWSRAR